MEKSTQWTNFELTLGSVVNQSLDIGYIFLPLLGKLCGCCFSGASGRPSGNHRPEQKTTLFVRIVRELGSTYVKSRKNVPKTYVKRNPEDF